MVLQVFISSTFHDFSDYRKGLQEYISKFLEAKCVIAEYQSSEMNGLQEDIEYWIDRSEIIILLIGARIGAEWAQKEIIYAKEKDKLIFPYMKDDVDKILTKSKKTVDIDEKKRKRLIRFIEYIYKEISPNVPRFHCFNDILTLVVRDIQKEITTRKLKRQLKNERKYIKMDSMIS